MKTLSIVIPFFNEEERIGKTLKALQGGFKFGGLKLKEVIFVNDGSNDKTISNIKLQTKKLEKKLKAKIKIISYKQNKGKGFAVRTGLLASKSDYGLFFDVDMSTPLDEFTKFLPYINKKYHIICGTRKNGKSTVVRHQALYREVLGKGFTKLSNTILGTDFKDFTCGFKAYSQHTIQTLVSNSRINGWGFDSELLFLAHKKQLSIAQVPVLWSNDERSKVRLWKDLPKSFYELLKIRIN